MSTVSLELTPEQESILLDPLYNPQPEPELTYPLALAYRRRGLESKAKRIEGCGTTGHILACPKAGHEEGHSVNLCINYCGTNFGCCAERWVTKTIRNWDAKAMEKLGEEHAIKFLQEQGNALVFLEIVLPQESRNREHAKSSLATLIEAIDDIRRNSPVMPPEPRHKAWQAGKLAKERGFARVSPYYEDPEKDELFFQGYDGIRLVLHPDEIHPDPTLQCLAGYLGNDLVMRVIIVDSAYNYPSRRHAEEWEALLPGAKVTVEHGNCQELGAWMKRLLKPLKITDPDDCAEQEDIFTRVRRFRTANAKWLYVEGIDHVGGEDTETDEDGELIVIDNTINSGDGSGGTPQVISKPATQPSLLSTCTKCRATCIILPLPGSIHSRATMSELSRLKVSPPI